MQQHGRLIRVLSLAALIFAFQPATGPAFAADTAGMVRQIQKSFSSIQRRIVTQPKKAEEELAKTMALFEELRTADPSDRNIPRLEKKIEQLSGKLEKRLGRTVKPVQRAASSPLTPAPKAALEELPPAHPTPPAAPTGQATKLPGSVVSRIKKIDKSLGKVNTALDKHSVQRADFEFKKVNKILKEIQDRYGDKAPPEHPEMVALGRRIAQTERRLRGAADTAAEAADKDKRAKEANAALAEEWIGKMAPYIARESDKRLSDRLWELTGEEAARNRQHYDEASALLREYATVDFHLGKPMALQNTERSLQDMVENLEKAYAKQATEQGSEEWVQKLEPFVTSMGGKRLIASYTSDIQEMQRQKRIYGEASKLFEQYLKAEFPQGKSPKLQDIEGRLADELAKFPEVLQRSVGAQVGNAEAKLDQEIGFLNSKQEWKGDTKIKPYTLSEDRIEDARKLVGRAAELLSTADPRLAGLNAKMTTLVMMNDERRKVRAERTRMMPDRFAGDGKGGIKQKAVELVKTKFDGIQTLRSIVISEDWKEESVQEWTDTTRTAVRHRTTRSVTAQVAGKKRNGDVRLYTIHVAKDRRTDGTWGKLYGNLHSDLGDLMLEQNVNE